MEGFDDNAEIVKEFLVESYENLDQLDQHLITLEQNPEDQNMLASIFRTIHTIKGTCGFLGFSKLERLAHVGENLLSKLRDGELQLDGDRASALLRMIDAIRSILGRIENDGSEGDEDYSELVDLLETLQAPAPRRRSTRKSSSKKRATSTRARGRKQAKSETSPPAQPTAKGADSNDGQASGTVENAGELLLRSGTIKPEDLDLAIQKQAAGDPRHIGEILVEMGKITGEDVKRVLLQQAAQRGGSLAESTIRVDVNHLDELMNLVGELVLARNQILQFTSRLTDSAFLATTQRLNLITTELQGGVMKTRMQPIGTIWNKFPRVIRDLGRHCSKEVKIRMEGKETELDKTIIEAIRDPLTHLIRNSVDHGIECPQARVAAGKPAEGTVTLRAYHEGGQVNIEISDDGGGIDGERLKEKALEKGICTAEQLAAMNERELQNLIFMAGFSTAEQVTNVSGRGVGMDVVKTNIEKIGGSIDLISARGVGTTFKIKIPLTLAIIPALIVTTAGDRYAIPQLSLLELVRLEPGQEGQRIETIDGVPVYRLRERLLPLVYLDRELGLAAEPAGPSGDGPTNIVVLQAEQAVFGLVVDEINDTEEIVVKPLSKQLKEIDRFAGATIMGDGTVALILDVAGLASHAGVLRGEGQGAAASEGSETDSRDEERQTLLIFSIGEGRRMAMPLSLVARLEEVEAAAIEAAGGREVIQYRGEIMPLVRLDQVFGVSDGRQEGRPEHVVVYSRCGRAVGLVVEQILDIVEESLEIETEQITGVGLLGSAVVQGKITDLLDVDGAIQHALPGFFEESESRRQEAVGERS
ncbi:MAG TPA: chemotaxis protein CheA [Acidobacteria bacterium]|nr:chemotaxis protein CheA [Acidobacteriota bacterium]